MVALAGYPADHVEAFKEAGVDIRDPKFWQGGFDFLSRLVSELEQLPVEKSAPAKKAKSTAKKTTKKVAAKKPAKKALAKKKAVKKKK